jgi:hypothetical protein
MNKDYVRLTIGMSPDFKKFLRKCAAALDMPMSLFILLTLEDALRPMMNYDQIANAKGIRNYLKDEKEANKQP